jgi:hypothetical protein
MPLSVELGFIVQEVIVVLEDHEDSRFKEWLDQVFVVSSSAVADVFVEVSTSTTTDVGYMVVGSFSEIISFSGISCAEC